MPSLNKAILIGHVGKDPTVKYLSNGDAVCNFTLATSDSWKDKGTGEQKKATEWHNITVYRRLAEITAEYVKKGMAVYVEGKIQTRKWQDKEGQDRHTTEIIASEMKMLSGRGEAKPEVIGGVKTKKADGGAFDDFDDDIPF